MVIAYMGCVDLNVDVLPVSAWADGSLAELAGKDMQDDRTSKSKSTQPAAVTLYFRAPQDPIVPFCVPGRCAFVVL